MKQSNQNHQSINGDEKIIKIDTLYVDDKELTMIAERKKQMKELSVAAMIPKEFFGTKK